MGLKASEGTLGSGLGSLGVMYFALDTVMMYMTAGRACVCHGSLVCAGTITSKTRMSEFSKSTLWLEGATDTPSVASASMTLHDVCGAAGPGFAVNRKARRSRHMKRNTLIVSDESPSGRSSFNYGSENTTPWGTPVPFQP